MKRTKFVDAVMHLAALVVVAVAAWIGGASSTRTGAEQSTPRSPEWPKVRAEHLKLEPACAVCGKKADVEVHHVKPFHVHPELELDDGNLITLCRQHHTLFGHLDSWESWNVDVRKDTETWRQKIKDRP